MKNNNMLVAELQNKLNERLKVLEGRKYIGTEFHKWYANEIMNEFKIHGIEELHAAVWGIVTDMCEHGLHFCHEDIAKIEVNRTYDKRIKYADNRGKIISITVEFRKGLLPLTLNDARTFLFEEKRKQCVKRCIEIRNNAMKEMQEAEKEIERLKGIIF